MIQTIHRHPIAYVLLTLGALAGVALLAAGIFAASRSGVLNADLLTAFILGIFLVLLTAYVWGYVYWLSVIQLSPDKLEVVRWMSLFSSQQAEAEWREVEDITIQQGGLLSQLLGLGTIAIQTAGTKPNLTISYVPDVESLRDEMMKFVESAKASHGADA